MDKPVEKKHYYLVSGEVEYLPEDRARSSQRVNVIHASKNTQFPLSELAEIQKNLQMGFHSVYSRISPMAPEITNVVVLNLNYLGWFSKEEFHDFTPEQPDKS